MPASRVVGLTGLPCSGKSFVAGFLAECGAQVIDVDRVGHEALEAPELRDALVKRFGADPFSDGCAANRSALARIVFSDATALLDLEALLHPWMCARVRERIEGAAPGTVWVLDAALLVPMGLHHLCDAVLLVEASFAVRRKRAEKRGWSNRELKRREERLVKEMDRIRQAATHVLPNEDSSVDLRQYVIELWKEWKDGCKEESKSKKEN